MTPTTWIRQQWAWLQCVPPRWWVIERDLGELASRRDRRGCGLGSLPGTLWGLCCVSSGSAVGSMADLPRSCVRGTPVSEWLRPLPAPSPEDRLAPGVLGLSQSPQSLPPIHRGSPGCPLEPLHSPIFRTPLSRPLTR